MLPQIQSEFWVGKLGGSEGRRHVDSKIVVHHQAGKAREVKEKVHHHLMMVVVLPVHYEMPMVHQSIMRLYRIHHLL